MGEHYKQTTFTLKKARSGYAPRIMQQASLRPITRWPVGDPVARTGDYMIEWRRFVLRLRALCVTPPYSTDARADSTFKMLNCRPPFAYYAEPARACRATSLCPSCWARWVAGKWAEVDRRYFPAGPGCPPLADVALVTREVCYRFSQAEPAWLTLLLAGRRGSAGASPQGRNGAPNRRAEFARLGRLGVIGGVESTYVELPDAYVARPHPLGAYVEFRQLMFCPLDSLPGVIDNPLFKKSGPFVHGDVSIVPEVEIVSVERPTRRDLAEAWGDTMRYSESVFHASEEFLLAYLAARKGEKGPFRLATTFGKFHLRRHKPGKPKAGKKNAQEK
jgi:hypothetical protein